LAGFARLFWLLALAVLILFARNGLYASSPKTTCDRTPDQLVYLGSLALIYLYDPKLAPPRSLFLAVGWAAWAA
jgi:hypothetical protein